MKNVCKIICLGFYGHSSVSGFYTHYCDSYCSLPCTVAPLTCAVHPVSALVAHFFFYSVLIVPCLFCLTQSHFLVCIYKSSFSDQILLHSVIMTLRLSVHSSQTLPGMWVEKTRSLLLYLSSSTVGRRVRPRCWHPKLLVMRSRRGRCCLPD